MIKSKHFWIAAILVGFIFIFSIDIAILFLDWEKDVRGEIITIVHDSYPFSKEQKTEILERVFQTNRNIVLLVGFKLFACIIFLVSAFLLFRKFKKSGQPGIFKPALFTVVVVAIFFSIKIFILNELNSNDKIKFVSLSPGENSFNDLYKETFKGKVVYVDFWGTTCFPCLDEFRNFTKPMKDHFQQRSDLIYLYISRGNRYMWKKQVRKYNIEGYHIFLDDAQYDNFFRNLTRDSVVTMPHYLIISKQGAIAVANAPRPSDSDSLYLQLDRYLN